MRLRRLEISDVDDIYEYAKERDAFIFTDGFPHAYEDVNCIVAMWRNEAYQTKRFIRWAIELKTENKAIGGVYLFAPCGNDASGRRTDIGIEISKKYWNKGFASEAIQAACFFGLKNMGLVRVQAQVISENIGSIRAFEKAGFVNEGMLRNFCHYEHNGNRFKSMIMLSKILDDLHRQACCMRNNEIPI